MKKILLLISLMAVLLIVLPAAAQDTTPEAAAEPSAAVTPEATAEATLEPGQMLEFPGPGSYTVHMPYDDGDRTYHVYIPVGYRDDGDPLPLVIVMHGAGGNGDDMASMTNFNALADGENFVVVYPNGVNGAWNDGRSPGAATNHDDVRFLSDIVTFMKGQLNIDGRRVYATGYSMGGMMSYRVGCELSDVFAAVGSVASTMPYYLVATCDAAPPIPLIVIQGTDDPIVPWMGVSGAYLSATQTLGYWGLHNECTARFDLEVLPDVVPADYTRVVRQALPGCSADFVLYGIYLGGHTWPAHSINARQLGATTQDIDATAVIWDFFKVHSLPGE